MGTLAAVLVLTLAGCAHGTRIFDTWSVPGEPSLRVAFVERPAAGTVYGPQLIAVRARHVLHESARLYDADFVTPKFFELPGRTLMLADYGAEDNWGMLAWSFEQGTVRDLGTLEIALSEVEDGFTRGAAVNARVEVIDGGYVIRIPGPVLLDPRGRNERLLAKEGEVVTFRESAGKLVLTAPLPH